MAGAADRPIFDFPGSLELAKALHQYANLLDRECGLRALVRDRNLDAWKGKLGDNHRERAETEDTDTTLLYDELKEAADDWRTKWQESATEMNRVLYNEMIEAQQEYVNEKTRRANAEKSWWDKVKDVAEVVAFPPYAAYQWLEGGKDNAHQAVEMPKPVQRPTIHFWPAEPPFARYERHGDRLVIAGYEDTAPANANLHIVP